MSGHSYSDPCPNCESVDTNFYQDHKPFQLIQFECLSCGVYSHTTIDQMDLNDLNETRKDYGDYDDEDFIPLETQKPINKEWFSGFMPKVKTHETRIYGISNDYMDKMDWGERHCRKLSDKEFIHHAENDGSVWSDIEILIHDINEEGSFAIFRVIKVEIA